jgi:hypothetical protein
MVKIDRLDTELRFLLLFFSFLPAQDLVDLSQDEHGSATIEFWRHHRPSVSPQRLLKFFESGQGIRQEPLDPEHNAVLRALFSLGRRVCL